MIEGARKIRQSLENARILTGAAYGAATRKGVLNSPLERYLERLREEPESEYNPPEAVTKKELTTSIIDALSREGNSRDTLLTEPWSSRRIKPSRLAATLIAFSNDHGKKTVPEFFPVDEIFTYLQSVKTRSSQTGKQLTIADQFNLALEQTHNNPIAAALLAHSAYRSVARSSDTRLNPHLVFEVESNTQPITMMNIARSTADFSENDKRDPLGNTYHWWSQFTAGMTFALLKRDNPFQVLMYNKAFSLGPELTVALRSKLLHMPLAAGDHKAVDRQGMRLGRAMGNLLVNKIGV